MHRSSKRGGASSSESRDRLFLASRSIIETLEERTLLSTTPGTPDTTFNQTGINALSIPNMVNGVFFHEAVLPSGKILAVGQITLSTTDTGWDVLLAQFNSNGTLDTTFGGGTGYTITDINSQDQQQENLGVQADGKIVVLATSGDFVQDLANGWIIRYNSNGTLDTTFGTSGAGYVPLSATLSCLGFQGNGDILAAGSTTNSTDGVADAIVERFTPAGKLDTTFGNGGTVTTELGSDTTTDDAFIYSVVQDGSGRIILGGTRGNINAGVNDALSALVMAYTPSGKLDTTFGDGSGYATASVSAPDVFDDINLLPNGNIELNGFHDWNTTAQDNALVEFTSSGQTSLVATPSVFGGSDTPLGVSGNSSVVQSNGQIVGVAASGESYDYRSVLYRMNADGTLDSTFGDDGIYDTGANQNLFVGEQVALQANGAILVPGYIINDEASLSPALARYNGSAVQSTTGAITGNVFDDVNADHTDDAGDTNLAGWTVYIDENGNGVYDNGEPATVTDANGDYTLSNLTPGSYSVRVVAQSGYTITAPVGTIPNVTVTAGKTTTAPEFGYTLLPVVTTNPVSQTVAAGTDVKFTAAAASGSPLTVQWELSTNAGKTFAAIPGGTATTLDIGDVTATETGYEYEAVFTNSGGPATTTEATLTVKTTTSKPVVTLDPQSKTVTAGTDVQFTAAASGSPTPTVQWELSTNAGKKFTAITNANSTTLDIGDATSAENGYEYEAVFTNSAGTATTTAAILTVKTTTSAPVVTLDPKSQTVTAGTDVKFTAAASGSPAPTVQWYLAEAGSSKFKKISGATSTTLDIGDATTAQSGGQYEAIFTNSAGSATTTIATLTVNPANTLPLVTTQPKSKSAKAGANVTFTAAATGTPTPTVQWYVELAGTNTFKAISGQTSDSLTLDDVTASENGNEYEAIFTNVVGSTRTSAAELTVKS